MTEPNGWVKLPLAKVIQVAKAIQDLLVAKESLDSQDQLAIAAVLGLLAAKAV
jgi:hypothetical protein